MWRVVRAWSLPFLLLASCIGTIGCVTYGTSRRQSDAAPVHKDSCCRSSGLTADASAAVDGQHRLATNQVRLDAGSGRAGTRGESIGLDGSLPAREGDPRVSGGSKEFDELLGEFLSDAFGDAAATHVRCRVLAHRFHDVSRRWVHNTLQVSTENRSGTPESGKVRHALRLGAYVKSWEARSAYLRLASESLDSEVAGSARVALAALRDPKDREFFFDALDRGGVGGRWSSALGVLLLARADDWERLKRVSVSIESLGTENRGQDLSEIIMAATRRRVLDELMALRRPCYQVDGGTVRGDSGESRTYTAQSILDLALEGQLSSVVGVDRGTALIAYAWSTDRQRVLSVLSEALSPSQSDRTYDRVRCSNALDILGLIQSSDSSLERAIRELCQDASATQELRAHGCEVLARIGAVESQENRCALVEALLDGGRSIGYSVAVGVLSRGDWDLSGSLLSQMADLGHQRDGLSSAEVEQLAMALVAMKAE